MDGFTTSRLSHSLPTVASGGSEAALTELVPYITVYFCCIPVTKVATVSIPKEGMVKPAGLEKLTMVVPRIFSRT